MLFVCELSVSIVSHRHCLNDEKRVCEKTQPACHIWTSFACTGLWVLLSITYIRQIHCMSFSERWLWYAFELEDMYVCREFLIK